MIQNVNENMIMYDLGGIYIMRKDHEYQELYVGTKLHLPLPTPLSSKNGIMIPVLEEKLMCMEIIPQKRKGREKLYPS